MHSFSPCQRSWCRLLSTQGSDSHSEKGTFATPEHRIARPRGVFLSCAPGQKGHPQNGGPYAWRTDSTLAAPREGKSRRKTVHSALRRVDLLEGAAGRDMILDWSRCLWTVVIVFTGPFGAGGNHRCAGLEGRLIKASIEGHFMDRDRRRFSGHRSHFLMRRRISLSLFLRGATNAHAHGHVAHTFWGPSSSPRGTDDK